MNKTVYISFSAEINPSTTESLIAVLSKQANEGIEEVHLLLSTPGGTVMNGLNLYNVLRGMPFKLITHNVGNVDSIGNAVFLAGSPRYACAQSTFMFHGVGLNPKPGMQFQEADLRENLDKVLKDQKRIGLIIKDRTKLDGREIKRFFREAQTIDATLAVSKGIVDEVQDVQIPKGTPVYSLVFKR